MPPENEDAQRARRLRSIAIALALGVFVILIFVVTLAKMGGHVFDAHAF